jgi:hypothetical protein
MIRFSVVEYDYDFQQENKGYEDTTCNTNGSSRFTQ